MPWRHGSVRDDAADGARSVLDGIEVIQREGGDASMMMARHAVVVQDSSDVSVVSEGRRLFLSGFLRRGRFGF